MANEKRLIKIRKRAKFAGDVHQELLKAGWDLETATLFVNNIPDADAVEVVRCKDCKHRGDYPCPMYYEQLVEQNYGDGCIEYEWAEHDRTLDNGFCSMGERKDNENP